MTSTRATRLPLPGAGGGPRGRAAKLAGESAFNGRNQMFGTSGVFVRDSQDTPSGRFQPGIARSILFSHLRQRMHRPVNFNHKPFGPDCEVNCQAGDRDLPAHRQPIRPQYPENLPGALFMQAGLLSQSACAGDILRRIHSGSVAAPLRIANTASPHPRPLSRGRERGARIGRLVL